MPNFPFGKLDEPSFGVGVFTMKKEKVCGIYKITSLAGRIYIGQSVDVRSRFASYQKLQCKTQSRLLRSFLKHGVENHVFEIIHHCEREELNKWEKHYVDLFQTFNTKHGLNLKDGGGNFALASEETKQKMSKAGKGKKLSPDSIRKREETRIILRQERRTMIF